MPQPQMVVLRARFGGTCITCNQPFIAGEEVAWRPGKKGSAMHARCAGQPTPAIEPEPAIIFEPQLAPDPDPTPAKIRAFTEPAQPQPAPAPEPSALDRTLAATIAEAVKPFIVDQISAKLDRAEIESMIRAAAEEISPRRLEIVPPDNAPAITIDNAHRQLPALIKRASRRQHVYLYGGRGFGKSTAAIECARALGLTYYCIALTPQTSETRVFGFANAHGEYVPTDFFRAWTTGGLMNFAELDNSSPMIQIALNTALANGFASFPHGTFPKHPDCIIVADGNTNGRGGDQQYPDRRPFDSAFDDRFFFMKWDEDDRYEQAITLSICPAAKPWLAWIRKVRAFAREQHLWKLDASPRASYKGAADWLDPEITPDETAEAVLFHGIDPDTKRRVMNACPLPEKG